MLSLESDHSTRRSELRRAFSLRDALQIALTIPFLLLGSGLVAGNTSLVPISIAGVLSALAATPILLLVGRLLGTRATILLLLLMLVIITLLFPLRFHLWGDGALRLRNLEAAIPIHRSGALEPGDTLIHHLIVGAGVTPELSFRLTGLLAGAVYLACLLLIGPERVESRKDNSWRALAWASPVWVVFFTGYVESYALYLALACLTICLMLRESPTPHVLAALAATCFAHLLGLILLPAVLMFWMGRQKREGRRTAAVPVVLALLLTVSIAWLLATGALSDLLSGGADPETGRNMADSIRRVLFVLVFTAPIVPLLAAFPPGGRSFWRRAEVSILLPTILICMLGLVLWRPARGFARDWDLLGMTLVPLFVPLLALEKFDRTGARVAVVVCVALGGGRIGAFHSESMSMSRFQRTLTSQPAASAMEELAIYRRDSGDLEGSSALFVRAFQASGNGRYLAQASEVERMLGDNAKAMEYARDAIEARPGLHVAHQQLLYAAAALGDAETAFSAAWSACSLGGADPMIWGKALETAVIEGNTDLATLAAGEAMSCGGDSVPEVLTNLGVLSYQTGAHEEASVYFERSFELDPTDPLPLFNQGCMLMESGLDSAGADSLFSLCLEVSPGYAPAERNLFILRGTVTGPDLSR